MESTGAPDHKGVRLPAVGGFRAALICAVLAAAVFAAFGGALGNGFAWDDDALIFIDCVTRRPLDWHAILSEPVDRLYRPLRTLTYILEFEIGGRNPTLFHATNIILHAAVCILFFLLAFRLSASLPVSVIAALLFGVHPVHAGTVGFISGGRSDLIATALALLSLILYLRGTEQGSGWAAHFLSLVSFALALCAKESSAVTPALVVCVALMRRGGENTGREWLKVVPYFVILAGYLYFRFVLMDIGGQSSGYHGGSLPATLLTTVTVWTTYVRDLIAPTNLCPLYTIDIQHHFTARVAGSAAGLALLAAASAAGLYRRRLWGFGLAWFLIALLPVSNLVPINSLKSDRFLYLPSMGMMLAASDLAVGLAKKLSGRGRERVAAAAAVGLAVVISVWFASITRPAVGMWKNDDSLWTGATACAGRSWIAWTNLGTTRFKAGRVEDAIPAMQNAARFNSNAPLVYNNLADAYGIQGDYERSLHYLERARALDPGDPEIYLKMGFALSKTGNRRAAIRSLVAGLERCRNNSTCKNRFEQLIRQLSGPEDKTR